MRNRIYLLLVILLLSSITSRAQTNGKDAFRLNGLVVFLSPFAEGRVSADGFVTVHGIEGNRIERMLINDSTGLYIGYVLEIERFEGSTKLKIAMKPLPKETARRMGASIWVKKLMTKWPNKNSYDPAPLPRYPEPQVIDISDVVKLTLWVNPETGAMIGDQLRFEADRPEPPHDFTLDNVALKLSSFRLVINGEVRSGEREFGGFTGPLPFFYVPGKGRFILSIKPHEGYDFQKIGVIDNNKISFSYGGDKYEWITRSPVLDHGGKWHLWVMHDESFQARREALNDLNLISKGNCCLYGSLSDVSTLSPAQKKTLNYIDWIRLRKVLGFTALAPSV